jgi:hypothetical protein
LAEEVDVTLLFALVAALLLALGYRAWWNGRHDPPEAERRVRLRGRVVGAKPGTPVVRRARQRSQTFALCAQGTTHTVVVGEGIPLIGRSTLRVGDRVTVDGLPGLDPAGETLYRESAMTPCIDALRLVTGSWPGLRWLPLLPLAALLTIGVHHGWLELERRALIARAAAYVERMGCPAGTDAAFHDDIDDFTFACVLPGGARHGPYAVWRWDGTLIERGEYHLDYPRRRTWLDEKTSVVEICPAKTPDMLGDEFWDGCRDYEVR